LFDDVHVPPFGEVGDAFDEWFVCHDCSIV
jgi:hypothetical protein